MLKLSSWATPGCRHRVSWQPWQYILPIWRPFGSLRARAVVQVRAPRSRPTTATLRATGRQAPPGSASEERDPFRSQHQRACIDERPAAGAARLGPGRRCARRSCERQWLSLVQDPSRRCRRLGGRKRQLQILAAKNQRAVEPGRQGARRPDRRAWKLRARRRHHSRQSRPRCWRLPGRLPRQRYHPPRLEHRPDKRAAERHLKHHN